MNEQPLTQPAIPATSVQSPHSPRTSRTGAVAGSRWQTGDKIGGRYEVHHIRKGGMGIVYLCYDHESQKPIVLKTFQDIFLSEKSQTERFMWEAETWVRLEKHMNIVRAYYVEKIEDKPYIFMEYILGEEPFGPELSSWIRGKGLNLSLSLNFGVQFCSGMLHAQKKFETMNRPFVHRDIKPSNIMVTRDRIVKVTDFGLVKAFQSLGRNRAEAGRSKAGRAEGLGLHPRGEFSRNARLHGPGAVVGGRHRPSGGHLCLWVRPLRDAVRQSALPL